MPANSHPPVQEAPDWQQLLRDKGYRLTPQRELVLSAVNVSTVYRTLELLEELELVRHAHLTDRAPTYHSAATPPHVHLVCRGCGKVSEVEPQVIEPLTDSLRERYGFSTDVGHLTVFGTCAGCSPR